MVSRDAARRTTEKPRVSHVLNSLFSSVTFGGFEPEALSRPVVYCVNVEVT
jgi:hypothetical protein